MDYTEEMLKEARHNAGELAKKIRWMQMDAQNLDFPDQTFDAVVSRNLTWNLENPTRAYQEWLRVLKKGGRLLNYDANWYHHLFDEEKRKEYEEDRKRVESLHINRPLWDKELLEDLACSKVVIEEDVWKKVWSREERANYYSTPMFLVEGEK